MNFTRLFTVCWFLALAFPSPAQWLFTDDQQKPRDYRILSPMLTVKPALFEKVPWQNLGPGLRRKVLFNDRLTMVWLEMDPAPSEPLLRTHYHMHDQITMLVEGEAEVRVGSEQRLVGPGAAYVAPSNVHHGLRPLSPRVVLVECFTPTREDFRGNLLPQGGHCTANQVRALVYTWFGLFDRQADPQQFLNLLDPQGWRLRFPEVSLTGHDEFCQWWLGLRRQYPLVEHEILGLDVIPEEGGFEVEALVEWRRPEHPPQRFRQRWWVRDHQGWPVIQRLEVEAASPTGRE